MLIEKKVIKGPVMIGKPMTKILTLQCGFYITQNQSAGTKKSACNTYHYCPIN